MMCKNCKFVLVGAKGYQSAWYECKLMPIGAKIDPRGVCGEWAGSQPADEITVKGGNR